MVSFDECGSEENKVIHSIKQGVEKGEIKLLWTVTSYPGIIMLKLIVGWY